MPRAALSQDTVVDLAMRAVDEGGPEALTLSALAARAGVATPSLYKHVRNLAELRELLSVRITDEISDALGQAVLGRSGEEAVGALMDAWRAYVTRHPHRYAMVIQQPHPGMRTAGERLMGIMLAALRGYGLAGSDAIHAARCLRAAAHGFAVLEASGAFGLPELLDESYDLLKHMVVAGLATPR
ncbi:MULTISPECIES: TetR/AcrR family transcriptional regulator [unclassified Nonomuraea]|uniref:TetR/AcrR family transcriptional regulator n=1 Tax=unclassified Nonomuraea TaxID=2593643 RepID=UPI003408DBFC